MDRRGWAPRAGNAGDEPWWPPEFDGIDEIAPPAAAPPPAPAPAAAPPPAPAVPPPEPAVTGSASAAPTELLPVYVPRVAEVSPYASPDAISSAPEPWRPSDPGRPSEPGRWPEPRSVEAAGEAAVPPPLRSGRSRGRIRAGLVAAVTVVVVGVGSAGVAFAAGLITVPGSRPDVAAGPATAPPSAEPQGVASAPVASPTARPSGSRSPVDGARFKGRLASFARSWLAVVSECRSSGESGGPALGGGERARVMCAAGPVTVYFVEYGTVATRDKARARFVAENAKAATMCPGVAKPTRRKATSGNSTGSYVEFGRKAAAGGQAGRVVAGVWWDDARTPVAGYLLAYWDEGLGGSWTPLRELWRTAS